MPTLPATPLLPLTFAYLSVLFTGAIFGFFYAWICSTMWGLGAAPPLVAVEAMQAMNASVRNAVFAPGFFGPGLICLITAGLAFGTGNKGAAGIFAAAGLVYILGGNLLTFAFLVPMNEELATQTPETTVQAQTIWDAYSPAWQAYNITRTVFCGISLLLAAIGLRQL